MPDLGQMLAPVGIDGFRDRIAGRESLVCDAAADSGDALPGWSAFPAWARYGVAHGALRVARAGTALDAGHLARRFSGRRGGQGAVADFTAIQDALASGCTVMVNGIERQDPWVAELARQIAQLLAARVEANVYAVETGTHAAFPMHWDDHDVMVLQLAGAKDWEIAPPTCPAPLIGMDGIDDMAPPDDARALRLQPGQLLYLPRGWWHRALSDAGGSLHITFSIAVPVRADVIRRVLDDMVHSAVLREDVTRGGTGGLTDAEQCRLHSAVVAACSAERLGAQYRQMLAELHPPAMAADAQVLDRRDAWLVWHGPVPLPVERTGDTVEALLGDHQLSLPRALGPALESLARIGPRPLAAILEDTGLPEAQALPLLTDLVRIGALTAAFDRPAFDRPAFDRPAFDRKET